MTRYPGDKAVQAMSSPEGLLWNAVSIVAGWLGLSLEERSILFHNGQAHARAMRNGVSQRVS